MTKVPPYRTLRDLPGVGNAVADDYRRLGITDPGQVSVADPFELFERLVALDSPTVHAQHVSLRPLRGRYY